MTVQEKIDIMSLKFDILWYKAWLEFPDCSNIIDFNMSNVNSIVKTWELLCKYKKMSSDDSIHTAAFRANIYVKKKYKFESSFMSDGGRRLRSLIKEAGSCELEWEIPKGRKNRNESDLVCAIREFEEETNVPLGFYNIIFDINPITESYTSSGVKYVHTYYAALASNNIHPFVNLGSVVQISEIDAVEWMSLDKIKDIDPTGKLYETAQSIFDAITVNFRQ
jgi:8-oxo-dGTP pyrophosphatase MutT (NUDIX family)